MTPLVTVVIPTRNRAGMLLQTLRTVLAQDVSLEVIVVDEGSTDDTANMVRDVRDRRIRLLRHEHAQGLPNARNAGLRHARGEIMAFVDDDDLWLPAKLPAQLDALRASGRDWAFGGALTFSEGPRLLAVSRPLSVRETVTQLPYRNTVPGGGSNVVVRRAALVACGGFHVAPRTVEDWDLWIRLSQHGDPAIVNDPVVAYRVHAGNMSRQIGAVVAGTQVIDERYRALRGGNSLDWADLYRWLAHAALVDGHHWTAAQLHLVALRAGHQGSLPRLARSLVPLRPRPPLGRPQEAAHWLDTIRARRVIVWPEGTQAWLERVLAGTPGDL